MKAAVFCGKHNLKIEELEAPRPNADDVAVVIGCGMIGLIMLRLVKNAGAAKVIAIEPKKDKRELAGKKRLSCFSDLPHRTIR